MEPRTLQQTIDEMRGYIQRKTDAGFDSPEDTESSALEVFSDDQESGVLRPIAERLTREAVEAHLAAQEQWPAVTDRDPWTEPLRNWNGQESSPAMTLPVIEPEGMPRSETRSLRSVRPV